jgi:hypothetical protein
MSFKNMPDIGQGITAEQLQSMTPEETKEWRKREKELDVKKKQTKKAVKVSGLNQEHRFFKSIEIKNDGKVKIIMIEKVMMGVNAETGKEIWHSIPFNVGPIPYEAHKDLKKALKDLTSHALTLYGFPEASIKDTTVSGVQVAGEVENHNARVLLTIEKEVHWSNKPIRTKLPQLPLFDTIVYDKTDKLVELLKILIKEVWLYIGGKHEHKEQLSIFND